ncbi:MAG: hypothetical protein JKY92_08350 [Magnetovibrio sp.]|nr:hypothetical protein [Magnetovibrio sp.]
MTKKPLNPMTKPAAKRIGIAAVKNPDGKTATDKFPERARDAAFENSKIK